MKLLKAEYIPPPKRVQHLVQTEKLDVIGDSAVIASGYATPDVRTLAIDGVAPTPETIADNTYPLRSAVFVVGLAEPQEHYRAFIGWVQSPAGQAVVARYIAPLPSVP